MLRCWASREDQLPVRGVSVGGVTRVPREGCMLGLQLLMLAGSIQGCQGCFCAPYCRQFGFGRGVGIGGFFQNGIVNRHTERIRRPSELSFYWWSCRVLCRPEWVTRTTRRSPFITAASNLLHSYRFRWPAFSKWVKDYFLGCVHLSSIFLVCGQTDGQRGLDDLF